MTNQAVRVALTSAGSWNIVTYSGACVPLTCGYPARCLRAAGYARDSSAARLRCVENGGGILAADLSHLATARKVGFEEPEITRTLDSARKTSQGRNRCSARVLALHMVRPPDIAGERHARMVAWSRRLWTAVLSSAMWPRRVSW